MVKVALLVPLSAQGQPGVIGKSLKQAAELALFERDNPNLQLIVKDDKGTPEGAKAAAEDARQGRRRADPGPAVCQVGRRGGAGGAPGRRAGHRLLQRPPGGRRRRLPAELPAGARSRARRGLRRAAGQAPVCGADPARTRSARSPRRPSRTPSAAPAARSWRSRPIRPPPTACSSRMRRISAAITAGRGGRRAGRRAVPAGRAGATWRSIGRLLPQAEIDTEQGQADRHRRHGLSQRRPRRRAWSAPGIRDPIRAAGPISRRSTPRATASRRRASPASPTMR